MSIMWPEVRLGLLVDSYSGGTPKATDERFWSSDGVPFVTIGDLAGEEPVMETERGVTDEGIEAGRLRILSRGTLLLAMYASLGKVGILGIEATINQAILALWPRDRLARRFLLWVLIGSRDDLLALAKSTTQDNLSLETTTRFRIPLPPLDVQKRIADYLDEETARIDDVINKNRRLIELLDEKRSAVISHTVTKGLDPDAPTKPTYIPWLGDIPAHWDVVRLGWVAALGTGHTPSRKHPEYWVDCTVPWVTLADVWQLRDGRQLVITETAEKVSELGLRHSSAVRHSAGTLILSRTASVGFSGILGADMAVSQDFATWTPGDQLHGPFGLAALRALKPHLESLTSGSTHRTIYMPDIQSIRIPLPPLAEQEEIATYLDEETERIDSLKVKLNRQIELLTEKRKALITAAVTGEFEVA